MPRGVPPSEQRRRWYARAEARLAGGVIALLVVAAGVAIVGLGDDSEPTAGVRAAALDTATASATPTLTARSATPTGSPSATPEGTSPPSPTTSATATFQADPAATAAADPSATATAVAGDEQEEAAEVSTAIELRPPTPGQGETLLVRTHAPSAASAVLKLRAQSLHLQQDGEVFWGVVGVPLGEPLGTETLTITLRDAAGEALETLTAEYEVVHVERPVDYLTATDEAVWLSTGLLFSTVPRNTVGI